MSATINVELFQCYFKEEGARFLQVPGRLFPIKLRYMPPPALEMKAGQATARSNRSQGTRMDPAPFVQVLNLIDQQYPSSQRGDVLIFVSGVNEIDTVCEAIKEYAAQQTHWLVLPLHSGLALAEQDKVFDYAPEGSRKCIVSTNIAETSLTVDGVRFVVDSGKVKEISYDAACKGQRLKEFWVSKSSAEQRKGRAGRTGPGFCFRLYSQQQFDAFEAYPTPEIYRVPLDTMLLQMVSMGLPDVRAFPFIEPPESERIEQTILALKQKMELSIGKMLLKGCVYRKVDQLLTLGRHAQRTKSAYQLCLHGRALRTGAPESGIHSGRPLHPDETPTREWLQLKMARENTRKWCHRRGIEEQRFYEVSKMRQQFQRILESCNMAPPSTSGALTSAERASRHGEVRQLKALKRRQRFEQPRHPKLLKHQHSGGQYEEPDENYEDVRDVDFRLRHDARQLALLERSARLERNRDVVLLKLLLVSGFYPQLAISDEFNYCKGGGQQFFHTRMKPFISLHPNSHFAKYYECLKLAESDLIPKPAYYTPKHPLSERHQLLCYQSLLETAKPYLMSCIRLPVAHTLLLFGFAIDTNADLTQMVFDGWLCLDFPVPDSGMKLLCRAIKLRRRWSSLLCSKLDELNASQKAPAVTSKNITLWHELIDFMGLDVPYAVSRLLPADLKRLYTHQTPMPLLEKLQGNPFDIDYPPSPNMTKGGINVSENVVYGCVADQPWTLAMQAALQARAWQCSKCDFQLEKCDMLEQLVHRQECKKVRPASPVHVQQPPTARVASNSGNYFCESCKRHLNICLPIDILRHRRQCVKDRK
ncbi:GL14529 [Drosophila persimilis]|uniref:GL14529 n=1 Tax=Drosophila persimilis TaxID=7234 RepID=B4GW62_DROPE|nr:GL14529 [Drosophila persimilis]